MFGVHHLSTQLKCTTTTNPKNFENKYDTKKLTARTSPLGREELLYVVVVRRREIKQSD